MINALEKKKVRRKYRLIESGIQVSFLKWLALQYPFVRKVTFSIPNGGARTPWYGARLRNEGLKKGVPDIFVAYPKNNLHGLFLEFKREGEKPSPDQNEMKALLEEQGYKVSLVFNIQDAIIVITNYLKNLT